MVIVVTLVKIGKLSLAELGVQLITRVTRNMKLQTLDPFDSAVLRKRGIIESLFNLMKSQFDLEHTRHRSKIGLKMGLLLW